MALLKIITPVISLDCLHQAIISIARLHSHVYFFVAVEQ